MICKKIRQKLKTFCLIFLYLIVYRYDRTQEISCKLQIIVIVVMPGEDFPEKQR